MVLPPPPRLPLADPSAGRRPFALLNDEPVADETEDLLGARRASRQLTDLLIASRGATPFTLAVDAGWGMGKSSLMRLVDARLSDYRHVHTVWYNAWTSTGADALEGLIKSVLLRVDPGILRSALRRIKDSGALLRVARALTVLAAGPLGAAGLVDELWRNLSADATARNGMRDTLREVVGSWTAATPDGEPGRLLVVFIDDLDRCPEETLLAVCEAVKVYLDVPGLAFVIGCDRSAVGPDGLLRDLSPSGAAFMEKIFQTSYRIPTPSGPDIQSYVRRCARAAGIDDLLDDPLVELLAFRAARNPRRVKRLVNGLLLEAALNPIWDGVTPEAVIRTLLLQYLYPDFHRRMTLPTRPGAQDVVGEFQSYRRVRRSLWSGGEWPAVTATVVGEFLRTYGVPPLNGPADRSRALADLEQQLPFGFSALARDPAFTSLVDDLVALPEARLVLRRLRDGLDERAPLDLPDSGFGPPTGPWGTPAGAGDPLPFPSNGWSPDNAHSGPGSHPAYSGPADPAETGSAGSDRTARRPDPLPFPVGQGSGSYPGRGVPVQAPGQQPVSGALEEPGPIGRGLEGPAGDWYAPLQASYLPQQEGSARPRRQVIAAGFGDRTASLLRQGLRDKDIDVTLVETAAALREALREAGPPVVVMDLDRGDPSPGDVIGLRNSGLYFGPVVLHTSRLTPALREEADRMRVAISDDLATVIRHVEEAALPPHPGGWGGAAPTDPRAPGSAGPPR